MTDTLDTKTTRISAAGRWAGLLGALALGACAPPRVPVTVSTPKVWGDDQVLRTLADRQREVLARGPIVGAPAQEALAVRHDASTALRAGLDLLGAGDVDAGLAQRPAHPGACGCARCDGPTLALAPALGPSAAEGFQARIDAADLGGSQALVAQGDATLLHRRSRAVLLRFDVCFNAALDLGDRRRFVVVAFVVRPRDPRCPRPVVYRLAPEQRSIVSDEQLLDVAARSASLDLLGAASGVGLTGGWSRRDRAAEQLQAVLATPLVFAIHAPAGRGDAASFAFAFGPRRRVVARSLANPARWFGAPHAIGYELQPGPRACEAVLVFPDVDPEVPLDLAVAVCCDGQLVAEEQVDVARALGRPLETFEVPGPDAARGSDLAGRRDPADLRGRWTERVLLVTSATTDVVLDGPTFSTASQVLIGPVVLPAHDVTLAGRGRLLVRVRPSAALAELARLGCARVPCRVVTPDEPDFGFEADLAGGFTTTTTTARPQESSHVDDR